MREQTEACEISRKFCSLSLGGAITETGLVCPVSVSGARAAASSDAPLQTVLTGRLVFVLSSTYPISGSNEDHENYNATDEIVYVWKGLFKNNPGILLKLHHCWGRKRMKASEQINNGASTPAAGATEAMRVVCGRCLSLLGRIGRWSGREIARSALALARSAQAERDNESRFLCVQRRSSIYKTFITSKIVDNSSVRRRGSDDAAARAHWDEVDQHDEQTDGPASVPRSRFDAGGARRDSAPAEIPPPDASELIYSCTLAIWAPVY
ncbi:hypothetical protein EVAR_53508_1 [Eumeta japonica]|uniref:Uncharacterized protein n=1 Tax=Eumeta variegata TaxID=151549 RepID=A0A4C1Y7G8_EUMVA|nr:hypothetical protein EVAR_53508_1 [Eumeta japonica]